MHSTTFTSQSCLKPHGQKSNQERVGRAIQFQRQKSFDMELLENIIEEEAINTTINKINQKHGRRKARRQLLRQATSLSTGEVQSLQAAFTKLDQDGNGYLSYQK